MPDPKDVNDVLLALSLYEGADSECDNEIVDGEIGPDPATVDGVLRLPVGGGPDRGDHGGGGPAAEPRPDPEGAAGQGKVVG